jgi:DNA primase large subunit
MQLIQCISQYWFFMSHFRLREHLYELQRPKVALGYFQISVPKLHKMKAAYLL